ncbi:MAG: 4-(cytidine 5'-diphospho)-2-C-methyl-D-erythritol kinase [Magnetococcales bacterium]|nr:4-(cytidine 5'-diphospho)-2-C-methyl-D-erythritol kinase [Magnetococcales bacterium]
MTLFPSLTPVTFSAPAKVNLGLRVVGRRVDGYHLLRSVMTFFPWSDRLTFTLTDDALIRLESRPPVTTRPGENLVYRAAEKLQYLAGGRRGVIIRLEKSIPAAAGLGGGSSDAATTLLALNRLWGLELSAEALSTMGLAMGADIPVFLGGHAALAEGVGERLTPLPHLPVAPLLVIHPGVALSTRLVFERFAGQLTNDESPISIPDARRGEGLVPLPGNDLEPVALALAPVIGEVMEALRRAGAEAVRMSGSGAAAFGVFATLEEVASAAEEIGRCYPGWRVASGMTFNEHPFAVEWKSWSRGV